MKHKTRTHFNATQDSKAAAAIVNEILPKSRLLIAVLAAIALLVVLLAIILFPEGNR